MICVMPLQVEAKVFFPFCKKRQAMKIEKSNLTVRYENCTILPLYNQLMDWIPSL